MYIHRISASGGSGIQAICSLYVLLRWSDHSVLDLVLYMFVFLLITVYYKTVYLSGTGLPRSSWKKRPLNGCGVVVLQDSCPLHCRFLKP